MKSTLYSAARSFIGRRLSSKTKFRILSVLKDVTFGRLRHKVLLKHFRYRRRHFRIGPENIPQQRVSIVVDLGANVGEFTTVAATFADEVHAFEPEPAIFEILKKNTSHLKNVRIHNAAVAAEDGECRLYRSAKFNGVDASGSLGSSLFSESAAVEGGDFVVAPQLSIETVLKRIGRPTDILKIDVEGAEVPMLEALFSSPTVRQVRQIYVETHEHVLPELAERTEALRKRARRIDGLSASFDWK